MLFTELALHEQLQTALVAAGFETATPIQAAAIPVALSGRDLVGTAQTGTGKTAAFVLPILQRIIATPADRRVTRAVILAPTRELVEQIFDVVLELGDQANVSAAAVYGGVSMRQQVRALRGGVEIVIACPGRLMDHMRRGNTNFRHLEVLVLDEADRMLDMGFMPAIQDILGHLPPERQTLLFSATFAKTLNAFVKQNFRNPVRVEVDTAVPAQTVQHSLYKVKQGMKLDVLAALLRKLIPASESVLIFTRMRETANQVAEHLHAAGMQVDVLHAEKTQRMRQDTMEQFRRGIVPYLVATDIAARGLDVSCISHVINYDMPASAEDYLHRIGRTGRMERAGEAISLVTRGDLRTLDAIERMLGKRISAESLTGLDLPDAEDATPAPRPMRPHADRPARNNDRPTRSWHEHVTRPRPATADADAPRTQRPRQEHGARPHRATADAPRAERPWQMNGARPHHAPADADAPRAERPWQKKGTRPHHAPADAPRVERTKRGHADQTAPGRPAQGDRFHRRRVVEEIDTAPMRKPTMGKPARFAEASGRPERAPRRRDTDDTATPRREGPAGRRPEREAADASRPAQAPEKRFTGRASVAKHHKKFGATKRQKGAIGGAYRQDAPAASPSSRPARGKRPSNRG